MNGQAFQYYFNFCFFKANLDENLCIHFLKKLLNSLNLYRFIYFLHQLTNSAKAGTNGQALQIIQMLLNHLNFPILFILSTLT
jgi:hypothetical protein